jgi:hypothetical protein
VVLREFTTLVLLNQEMSFVFAESESFVPLVSLVSHGEKPFEKQALLACSGLLEHVSNPDRTSADTNPRVRALQRAVVAAGLVPLLASQISCTTDIDVIRSIVSTISRCLSLESPGEIVEAILEAQCAPRLVALLSCPRKDIQCFVSSAWHRHEESRKACHYVEVDALRFCLISS